MSAYNTETREILHLPFRVEWFSDHFHEAPWDYCGVPSGIVYGWTTRDKRPGELVLDEDRGSRRYVDFAELCDQARAEKWSCDAARKLTPPATPRQAAAMAARETFDDWKAWCNNEWHWCGTKVTLLDPQNDDEETDFAASLWGLRDDDEEEQHYEEVILELVDDPTNHRSHAPRHRRHRPRWHIVHRDPVQRRALLRRHGCVLHIHHGQRELLRAVRARGDRRQPDDRERGLRALLRRDPFGATRGTAAAPHGLGSHIHTRRSIGMSNETTDPASAKTAKHVIINGVPHTRVRLREMDAPLVVAEHMGITTVREDSSLSCRLCEKREKPCVAYCGDDWGDRFVRDDALPYLALEGAL